MKVLSFALKFAPPASTPINVLRVPEALRSPALAPINVLSLAVLPKPVLKPIDVMLLAAELTLPASVPINVFFIPEVFASPALVPMRPGSYARCHGVPPHV